MKTTAKVRSLFSRGAAERVAMVPSSPWWGEHRSRYHFAAQHVLGKRVVDIACGTGYGSRILSDAGADLVVGIDRSQEALVAPDTSRHGWGLVAGDGALLPLHDQIADVVVSFETIEHIQEDELFVREIDRVLRRTGLLIISTPNALRTPKIDGRPANPFHVREYEPQQFRDLLAGVFSDVALLGQKPDPRYSPCPFWDDPRAKPRELRERFLWSAWVLAHRVVPFQIKDRVARARHNRSFYPGEYGFAFSEAHVASAHVVVALCRNPLRD